MQDVPYNPPPTHMECCVVENLDEVAIKNQAFAYMQQLEGWCSNDKAGTLINLILKSRPDVVVEIGVWGGKSLVPMAYALKMNKKGKIIGIDPWSNEASLQGLTNDENKGFWGQVDHEQVMWGLIDKLHQFDLLSQVLLIKTTSVEARPIHGIDILHIDGNHSDETSYIDVTKWAPLVKSGGLIVVDDVTWSENGVNASQGRAVEWLNSNCIKIAEFSDSSVWGVWIKP